MNTFLPNYDERYIVSSDDFDIRFTKLADARHFARLNGCYIIDTYTWEIIEEYTENNKN